MLHVNKRPRAISAEAMASLVQGFAVVDRKGVCEGSRGLNLQTALKHTVVLPDVNTSVTSTYGNAKLALPRGTGSIPTEHSLDSVSHPYRVSANIGEAGEA